MNMQFIVFKDNCQYDSRIVFENADEFVESQRLNLTRAKEGLRLAEVGYREGTNTQVEMIDAQAALTTARANYYQAIYSHMIAKLDLQKAMGILTSIKKTTIEDNTTGGSQSEN